MGMLKVVKNNSKLMRDEASGAILNMDTGGYESYINTRNKLVSDSEKMSSLEGQVNILTKELANIKSILEKL